MADLKAKHRAVNTLLEQRIAQLETRLAKETHNCRELEHRSVLAAAPFKASNLSSVVKSAMSDMPCLSGLHS